MIIQKKKFVVSKSALIFVAIFSILVGLIFPADRGESGEFFTLDLMIKALIISVVGGSIVTIISYLQYKKNNSEKIR
jgi:pilus assembly protein TadC